MVKVEFRISFYGKMHVSFERDGQSDEHIETGDSKWLEAIQATGSKRLMQQNVRWCNYFSCWRKTGKRLSKVNCKTKMNDLL